MKKLFFIVFAFTSLLPQQFNRFNWTEIATPAKQSLYFLHVASKDDLWLNDIEGNLFHKVGARWQFFSTPAGKDYTRKVIKGYKDKYFLLAAMDKNWHTHFYKFFNGKWSKFDLIYELPFSGFVICDSTTVYAYGNFGTLLKLNGEKWEKIKTPLTSHLNSAVQRSSCDIYFLTKSEGIVKFDGKNFFMIKNKKQAKEFVEIRLDKNDLFAKDIHHTNFLLKGDKMVEIAEEKVPLSYSFDELGFMVRTFINDDGSRLNIEIPKSLNLSHLWKLNNRTILFTSADGKLYDATATNTIFFSEKAKEFGLAKAEYTYVNFLSATDFTNDTLTDIYSIDFTNAFFEDYQNNSKTRRFYPGFLIYPILPLRIMLLIVLLISMRMDITMPSSDRFQNLLSTIEFALTMKPVSLVRI